MKQNHERRLERLEALRPGKPDHHVLFARDGHEDAAVADYKARTPPDKQADLLVVVRRFCEAMA